MNLDQNCDLTLGTRDAIHVPIVAATPKDKTNYDIKPGSFVRFIDNKFTQFEVCEKKDSHGIVNPFIDEIYPYNTVIVMLMPGITTPVRHNFDINTTLKNSRREILEEELKECQRSDPGCADCYEIVNNQVIRN